MAELQSGLLLCQTALWECFGDTISSFIACYDLFRETGTKFVPLEQFHDTEPVLTQILSKSFIYDMDF